MRLLLTGGSGLLAVNWARCRRPLDAVTLGLHERQVALSGVESCNIGLASVEQVTAAIDRVAPDLVVHTAGLTDVDRCQRDPVLARHINVDSARNVAQACAQAGVGLVHISSDHLFSGSAARVAESEPVAPVNIYGSTKAVAELEVLTAHPTALVVRTNFYGWGTAYRTSFSDFVINALRAHRTLDLFDDVFYTPILIDSLVQATHALIECGAMGIVHVVGNERISKHEFGLRLARRFEFDCNLIRRASIADRANLVLRPKDMSLDNALVCQMLGRRMPCVADDLDTLYRQQADNVPSELARLG